MSAIWILFYVLGLVGLCVFGVHTWALTGLYLLHRKARQRVPPIRQKWPTVTVQLPLYNEQHVVQRVIDAACALEYPPEALSIQVLDDSTDHTTALARERVALHSARGVQIKLLHRNERRGYKGGALAAGLEAASGDLIAILDADFVPPPDFLRRLVPYLAQDARVGMVQARWGHLNAESNWITRAQALSLDGQFGVVQAARDRAGLLVKFNGSAGIWRRTCIEDAGGWQGDTLTEDLDLSIRAQIAGWRFVYAPEVVVPAEVTPQLAALKRQQFRWAHGSVRTLIKLGRRLWRSSLPLGTRLEGLIHLSAYLANPVTLFLMAICLPAILLSGARLPSLGWFSLAALAAPVLFALSQRELYPDWQRRLAYLPILALLGVGLSLNNSLAVVAALRGTPTPFARTPKFGLGPRRESWLHRAYALAHDWTLLGEVALAAYAAIATLVALQVSPGLVPALGYAMLGYGFMGGLGLAQARAARGFSGS